jgi:hypothetical protein
MGVIMSLSRRKDKKAAAAAKEHQRKVEELCEMFPMLDKVGRSACSNGEGGGANMSEHPRKCQPHPCSGRLRLRFSPAPGA